VQLLASDTAAVCAGFGWTRVHGLACVLAAGAKKLGLSTVSDTFFDTLTVKVRLGIHAPHEDAASTHEALNAFKTRLLKDSILAIA